MDEALFCWFSLVFVALWRQLGNNMWFRTKLNGAERWFLDRLDVMGCSDAREHHFARGTFVFEWWFIAWLALAWFVLRAAWDIYKNDYMSLHFLLDAPTKRPPYYFDKEVDQRFSQILPDASALVTTFSNRTITAAQLREELKIPDWLKSVSMAAPIIGLTAFAFFSVHLRTLVMRVKRENLQRAEKWRPDKNDILVVGTVVMVQGRRAAVDEVYPQDLTKPYKVRFDVENRDQLGPCKQFFQYLLDVKNVFLPPAVDNKLAAEDETEWVSSEAVTTVKQDTNPWVADQHEDLAFVVIMMPAVFIAMSMKALIRILQVMTCSGTVSNKTWLEYASPYIGTYQTDLELCATMQYFTIWAFANLCIRCFSLDTVLKQYMGVGAGKSQVHADFAKLLTKKSSDYHRAFTIVGLLGLWGYLLVGLVRTILGMAISVMSEGYSSCKNNTSIAALQTLQLETLQPVFLFSMALCIFNMFIVLKMEDLQQPEAFGQNANLKFNACRVLLILGDMQKTVLRKLPLSMYQEMLLHSSLLIFECCVIIVFNSYTWNLTTHMRAKRARMIALKTWKEPKAGPKLLQKLGDNMGVVLHVVAPWAVVVIVLASATVGRDISVIPHPPEEQGSMVRMFGHIDAAIELGGPLFVFFAIIPRLLLLHDLSFLQPGGHGSQLGLIPKGWISGALTLVLLMTVIRLIYFALCHPYHDYISDHVVLTMSVIAVMQMEISLGHLAWKRNGSKQGIVVIVLAWVLVVIFTFNTWFTAKYYHSSLAVWSAFASSVLLFGGFVLWWLGFMLNPGAGDSMGSRGKPLIAGYERHFH